MTIALVEDDDETLAQRAATGESSAVDALLARVWPEVRRVALVEVGDPVLAEDAVQEALVRLLRFTSRFDPTRAFRPWLRTLVRNTCVDVLRRQGRPGEALSEASTGAPHPDRGIDLRRAARRAEVALGALTPRQRDVWLRCEHDGTSVAEVAEALHIAPATVRVLLHQARRTLRLRLLTDDPDLAHLLGEP
jgi:RNA polymerase sigma factor (sigma-70 family)